MNYQPAFNREVIRFLVCLLPLSVVGAMFENVELGVILGCFLFVVMHFLRMHRLRLWLEDTSAIADITMAESHVGMIREIAIDYSRLRTRYNEKTKRLRAAETYLQDAASSLSDGVVIVGGGGNITWSNDAAKRLVGVSFPRDYRKLLVNVVENRRFIDFFDQCDFDEPLEMLSPVDGHATLSINISFFGNGNRLLFVRDISKVRHLEKIRQDFIGNVSHELRTPLTVIKGYLEMIDLHLAQQQPQWERPIAQMREQAERMESLITDLMWLSRLESVPQEGYDVSVPVAAMVREIVEEASIHIAGQGKRFHLDVDDSVLLIGQMKEFRSAFNNLVVNACKYSDEKGQVTVSWQRVENGSAIFSVRDNGFGIAEQHLSRLTERFYRVDTSRSIATGGTGLGLAIVKHVMKRHNAELKISSVEGEGSTFSCIFPPSRVVVET